MPQGRQTVIFEKKDETGWVTFSRPERMNALAPESTRELWSILGKLEADPSVRVVVFTGQGEEAFCAGMDMAGMEKATPLAARRRSREIQAVTGRIEELSVPTVAAVNGVAMGVGLEICLACDLALASRAARFAFPEVRLGMIPCGGGTQRLARLVGLRRAREMVLSGRVLDAEQALEWGLVNAVVEAGELAREVEELAGKLAQGGRVALYQARRCLNHSLDMDLNRGLEYETECFTTCFGSGEPATALRRYARAAEEPFREEEAAKQPAPEPAEATAAPGKGRASMITAEPGREAAAPRKAGAEGSQARPEDGTGAAPEPEPEEEEEDFEEDIFE